jgi:hypothetical protein
MEPPLKICTSRRAVTVAGNAIARSAERTSAAYRSRRFRVEWPPSPEPEISKGSRDDRSTVQLFHRLSSVVSKHPSAADRAGHNTSPDRRDHGPYVERVDDLRRVRRVRRRVSLDFVAVDFGRVRGEEGPGRRRIGGYRRRREQEGRGTIGCAWNNAIEDSRQRLLPFTFDSGISQVEAPSAGRRVAAM